MNDKRLYIPFTLGEVEALSVLMTVVSYQRELTKQEAIALKKCKRAQRDYQKYLESLKEVSK